MKMGKKRVISLLLAVVMALTGVMPVMTAFADDGVEEYYQMELFYKDTNTMVPNFEEDGVTEYKEHMYEGDELNLTYKLLDSAWPDNGSVKWYSEAPELVDVTQDGVVKAFDSSKGAVIHKWIDNEVKTIPIVGSVIASVIEKALFNDKVNVDTLDTEEIVDIVIWALGSESIIADYIEAYQGQLVDSLRRYLDSINSDIHVELYDGKGVKVAEDEVHITVHKNEEWYANFLPNGTHITNKSQIATTQAKGNTVQLYAITTPQRLNFGVVYSVKSTSIFTEGKSVATVTDGGLVTFRNTGTVTILASPDSEQVIQKILELVNYFYKLENTGTLNTDKIAEILIKYMGIDINRAVLAGILDAAFAIYKIAGDAADPVQLTATAVEILANIILQMRYNDSITFEVVNATPIQSFELTGNMTVKEGTQTQLVIDNVNPTTGNKSDIVWSSADPSIATVDENGIVTGLDAGGSLGALSSQQVEITATSTTNNVSRTVTVTVTGKTGKYISSADINGPDTMEINTSQDYSYTVYPKRVSEADNLYITWGMLTGKDEDGNPLYAWADEDTPVSDGIGKMDSKGKYTTLSGGTSTIALMAKTGYYLSNGDFFEISSHIATKEVTTGIPVERIEIKAIDGTSNGDLNRDKKVTINGQTYEYVTIHKGVGEAYFNNGAKLQANVYPQTATNQKLTWVVDNDYYKQDEMSSDTHNVSVKQKAGHEVADTFNVYAVSQDGRVASNVITVCVTRNYTTSNSIDGGDIEMINGKERDVTHTLTFDGSWTGGAYACYKCNWYSSDESVLKVRNKGNDNGDAIVTGVDVGTATLYCVSADGAFLDSVEVTVKPDKQYLSEIVALCEDTIVYQTADNKSDYKKYMRKLDLAYSVLYEEDMASQDTCDTYADELLYAFIKIGGYVGVSGVNVLGSGKTQLDTDYITVKVGSTTSYKNYTYDFDFSVKPANAMYSNVVWTSSSKSVAVDKNGICRPVNNEPCSALITCTVYDYSGASVSASKYVAFARTKATGVSLDPGEINNAKIGEQTTLTPLITPTNTLGRSNASCQDVHWFSTNTKVATVDENGVITFVYGGNCTIVCTTNDGGFTAECPINVVTNYDALQLLVSQYTDLNLNRSNYYPDTWDAYTSKMMQARSMLANKNSSQEQVDEMYAQLEAAYKGLKKYTYIQTVELYLDGEPTSEFYQYDLSLLKEGLSYKNAALNLKVRLYPNNASYASVEWESSTPDIAVTTAGVCSPTANKSCYGMITCTVKDHYGNAFEDTVFVSFSYFPVTAIELSDEMINGNVGDTYQMSYVIQPVGTGGLHIGSAAIKDHYWESDNEEVAVVEDDGLVKFTGAGTTTIRCVSYDGGIKGECQVSTEGDRTKLSAALDAYKSVDITKYEYDYSMSFKRAYEAAEKALTDKTMNQAAIDQATQNLNYAATQMYAHPYVAVTNITVTYETAKRATAISSWKYVAGGTIGSNNAVSVNLSNGLYTSNNSYNEIVLTAAPYPSNAMYKSLAWSIDETSQMDVSIEGDRITCKPSKDDGAYAVIRCKAADHYGNNYEKQIFVVMADHVVTGFSITNEHSLTMYPNQGSHQINYSVAGSPKFGDVRFYSSDESVAKVNASGVITAVDRGTATITAKTLDGGYMDTVAVTVYTNFGPLAEKVNEYNRILSGVQDKYDYTEESLEVLQEEVLAADAMVKDGKASQKEVDEQYNKLVAAYNGLVKYVAAEGVKIDATISSNAVKEINPGFYRYTETVLTGKTIQLNAVTQPANSFYDTIEWISSNPEDVEVNEAGLVTNKSGAGWAKISCIITNVYGGIYESSVYVSFVRYGVTAVSFEQDSLYGSPQEVKNVNAVVTHAGGLSSGSTISDCVYFSSNEDVATVDDKGNVTFQTQGVATITAKSVDGGLSASMEVRTTWDTSSLQAAIAVADKIDYHDYVPEYGLPFNAALTKAKEVYANPLSSQMVIDDACAKLTEATTNLEGNEYVRADVGVYANANPVKNGSSYGVDDNNKVAITYGVNDGAMYKSINIDVKGVGITYSNGVITKTIDGKAVATVTVTVVDNYDEKAETIYDIYIVNKIVNIESFDITVDGEVALSDVTKSGYGRNYTTFEGLQLGIATNPANATDPVSIEWEATGAVVAGIQLNTIEIDENGFVTLTDGGKIRSTNTANITCTVTNSDGSVVVQKLKLTIAR